MSEKENRWNENTNHVGKRGLKDASLLFLILDSRSPTLMASTFFSRSWCGPRRRRRRRRRCRIRVNRGFSTNMLLIGDLRIGKFLRIGSCGEETMVNECGKRTQSETGNAVSAGGYADYQTLCRRSIHISVGPPLRKVETRRWVCDLLIRWIEREESPENTRFHVALYFSATWRLDSQYFLFSFRHLIM